jgi:NADH:ubiquinone oxidoreductase subunit F (NADH-binding)/(2Fe-2S) ferredoxin
MIELRDPRTLSEFRQRARADSEAHQRHIRVCNSTGCRALASHKVLARLQETLQAEGLADEIELVSTGCRGLCELGPLVTIDPERITYNRVSAMDAPAIVTETVAQGKIVDSLVYVDPATERAITRDHEWPFYAGQMRRVLALNGEIDPTRIEDYIAHDGYTALSRALCEMTPEQVIEDVTQSGLRGRGGAGFPTGVKWELCRRAPGDVKYIICNADEGDPGAFMDRSLLESNPHSVVEGMIVGAYAMGAARGFVYGSGFDLDIEIRVGSGAFVCGEETALMASIEGKIGEPRPRPPYPVESGLWGQPTSINNVKTWANVPLIVRNGHDWFASVGTEKSKGTMIFSLVGNIRNTGLVEVPMGISLRELIYDVGGGIPGDKAFKAAQIGGPSGGCIPAEHLDVPVDYESLTDLGAIVGSGGLVVCDEDTCMVDLARYFLKFTQEESCGKCVPCRVGTRAMLETLERICAGEGREGDIEYLIELGEEVRRSSLCGLGQTAPNPVLTTIRYFRDEYEAHIHDKTCPARFCKGLITYEIIPDLCPGCMVCARNCAFGAISGEKGEPHTIDPEACTQCGVCKSLCNFDAIAVL